MRSRYNHKAQLDKGRDINLKTSQQRRRLIGLIAAICIIITASYWPVLSSKALFFDDHQYLLDNDLVKNPSLTSTWRFLTEVRRPSSVRGYYQPISMISLMLDYAIAGSVDNLLPFRVTSLIWHLASTAALTILIYQLFGSLSAAVIAGLLFGLHPTSVECVSWVAERKSLIGTFFAFTSLSFYVLYLQSQKKRTYFICMALFILSMLSKPTAVGLPLVFMLLDYWPLRRFSKKTLMEKIPFFVLSGIFALITYVSQAETSIIVTPAARGLQQIILLLCHNITFYLYNFAWPVALFPRYPIPEPLNISNPALWGNIIGTIILLAAILMSLRWTRAILTSFLIFFICLLPAIGIVGFADIITADRFLYLPSVGILILLAWLIKSLFTAWGSRIGKKHIAFLLTAAILLIAETNLMRKYLVYWTDTVSLYKYILTRYPDDLKANDNLGATLAQQGRQDEAMPYLAKAVELNPENAEARSNLALTFAKKGQSKLAFFHFQKLLELHPDDTKALITTAWFLLNTNDPQLRDTTLALNLAAKACDLNKYKDPRMLRILAWAYSENGDTENAAKACKIAIDLLLSAGKTQQANEIIAQLKSFQSAENRQKEQGKSGK